jgi:hypothetical protein
MYLNDNSFSIIKKDDTIFVDSDTRIGILRNECSLRQDTVSPPVAEFIGGSWDLRDVSVRLVTMTDIHFTDGERAWTIRFDCHQGQNCISNGARNHALLPGFASAILAERAFKAFSFLKGKVGDRQEPF